MESNVELDDDMILVVVGDEDSYPDIIRPFQEFAQISVDRRISSDLTDSEGLLVTVKEEPIDILDECKEEPQEFSQLDDPDESFVNFLKCDENLADGTQAVRRRGRPKKYLDKQKTKPSEDSAISQAGDDSSISEATQPVRCRGRPKKSTYKTEDLTIPNLFRNSRRTPKPNPKYLTYISKLAKTSTMKDRPKLSQDLLKVDDSDFPSSWFENNIIKTNLNLKGKDIKKEKTFENCTLSSDNETGHSSETQKARRNGNQKLIHEDLKKESTNKEMEQFEDSVANSDNSIASSTESHKVRRTGNLKLIHEDLKRKSRNKEIELFDDIAVSSDNSIVPSSELQKSRKKANPKRNRKSTNKDTTLQGSAVSSDSNIAPLSKSQKVRRNINSRLNHNNVKIKKERNDSTSSLDNDVTPSLTFPNTTPTGNENTKNETDLPKEIKKEEENEFSEDEAITSDNNTLDDFFQFRDLRRSFNPNPKSYVADLVKQYPQFANDTEGLVEKLTEIMRQVKRPPLPKNYFIMNDVRFECIKCGHLSITMPAASRHYYEKHGPRYLICFACGVDFRSTTNLYKHEQRCIARDAETVLRARARVLGAKGRSRPFLDTVPKLPKKPPKREYLCTMCSAKFSSHTWLTAHMNSHLGVRPYVCDVCGLSYTSCTTLTKHRKKHSSQRYICDHCQRSFKIKSALVAHLNTHLPEYRFLCTECPKRYRHLAALQRHCERRHRGEPAPAACALCARRYSKMCYLKKHMLQSHGMHIMTRKTFYRQLPTMTESQLKEAKVIAKADLENISADNEVLDQDGPLSASHTEGEERSIGMKDKKVIAEDINNIMDCDKSVQEHVDKEFEVKIVSITVERRSSNEFCLEEPNFENYL